MNQKDIYTFARMLGTTKPLPRVSGWISICCPLAPWLSHKDGVDIHPSMGIKINEKGMSVVNCMTCGHKGRLIPLLWYLDQLSGEDYSDVARFVYTHDKISMEELEMIEEPDESTRIARRRKKRSALTYTFSPIPVHYDEIDLESETERDLSEFVLDESMLEGLKEFSPEALDYLHHRSITTEMVEQWEVGWQPHAHRLVIPIRDPQSRLVGISGRGIGNENPKYLHSTGFPRDYVLYGENKLGEGDIGYVTEGFFDVWRLHLYGYTTAVALLGTHLSKHQARRLVRRFKKIVLLLDGDKAGQAAAAKAKESLQGLIEVQSIVVPNDKDPDDLTMTQARDLLGDPAETSCKKVSQVVQT